LDPRSQHWGVRPHKPRCRSGSALIMLAACAAGGAAVMGGGRCCPGKKRTPPPAFFGLAFWIRSNSQPEVRGPRGTKPGTCTAVALGPRPSLGPEFLSHGVWGLGPKTQNPLGGLRSCPGARPRGGPCAPAPCLMCALSFFGGENITRLKKSSGIPPKLSDKLLAPNGERGVGVFGHCSLTGARPRKADLDLKESCLMSGSQPADLRANSESNIGPHVFRSPST
jgi:hypothetical protein